VLPTEIGVIAPSSDARLTLTTCHPRFSAAKRLIVVAQLEGTPTGLQTTDPGAGVLPES
jgi:sortase A